MKRRKIWLLAAVLSAALSMTACGEADPDGSKEILQASMSEETAAEEEEPDSVAEQPEESSSDPEELADELSTAEFSLADVEAYTGQTYAVVNGNRPYFSEDELNGPSYEYYSELDELGRCGVACARIGVDLMPTEKRDSISHVEPTGWQSVKYDNVDGKYLYNRCHLIGFQLAGENANEKNLITGTRYLNVDGMLPYENMIADYVKETENHVMYRVTPVFEGDNLVASGVLLEAESVEDQGEDIEFCVYVYNVQPGVVIDYATGESSEGESKPEPEPEPQPEVKEEEPAPPVVQAEAPEPEPEVVQEPVSQGTEYILNTNTRKFHYSSCYTIKQMKESNKLPYTGTREEVIAQGYDPCKKCNP